MTNKVPVPIPINATAVQVTLIPQTGMPPLHQSRSREIIYDALETDPRFILNPFGPQALSLSRPNHHW